MDWKLFLLGGLPPALAACAEILNPVAGPSLEANCIATVEPYLVQTAARERDRERATLVRAVQATAEGVAEVSGLIPTWISATAAAATVLADRISACPLAIGIAVWALFSVLFAPWWFAGLDYYGQATLAPSGVTLFAKTKAKRLSNLMVAVNGLIVLGVLLAATSEPNPAPTPKPAAAASSAQ